MSKMPLRTLIAAAVLTLAFGVLPGCERVIGPLLDALCPGRHDPTVVRPDSIRGDTTFYSYTFRTTQTPGWQYRDNGFVKIARIRERIWIIPKFHPSFYPTYVRADWPVANWFRLICNSEESVTSDEVRERAFATIERAGALIYRHLPADSGSDQVDHPHIEFFDVYHPVMQFRGNIGIPADVPLLRFIRALDDTSAFQYVFPYNEQWALLKSARRRGK